MKFAARLAALEKEAASLNYVEDGRRAYAEARMSQLQAAWEIMHPTMSDEHVALFLEGFEQHQPGDIGTPGGRLVRGCLQAMSNYRSNSSRWPYSEIPAEVTLAMPPAVADFYIAHPYALALHECENCGYKVPHTHFPRCPLCDGRVGWYAYYTRRKAEVKGS